MNFRSQQSIRHTMQPPSRSSTGRARTGGLILVVVQDPIPNGIICAHLETEGYRVHSTTTAEEALEILQQEPPVLILCDIVMPEMDGYALLQATRQEQRLRTIPFIFLSEDSAPGDRRRVKAIGGEDLITFPIERADLLAAVRTVMQRFDLLEHELQQQIEIMHNQILGLIQHEFRTPLTLIMGYAEYLQSTLDTSPDLEEIRMSIGAILEGSYRLNNLVESFLLLTELNQRSIEIEELSLKNAPALWREATTRLQREITETGLRITIENELTDERLAQIGPRAVYGESSLLCEAFVRLLDNAIRYRRPASRHIQLSVIHRADEIGWSIQDEGMGIPSDKLDEILHPFVRVHDSARLEQKGVGLGLAVVSRIVQLHGGQLTVASNAGDGSIFTLWLPLRESSTPVSSPDQPHSTRSEAIKQHTMR